MKKMLGCEEGEIFNLTWDRVDLDRRLIYLKAQQVRKGRQGANTLLAPFWQPCNPSPDMTTGIMSFSSRGNLSPGTSTAPCGKYAGRLAFSGERTCQGAFVFHDSRRTFRVMMRRGGVARPVVRSFTGHSEDMDDWYSAAEDTDRQQAVKALDALLTLGGHNSRHKSP